MKLSMRFECKTKDLEIAKNEGYKNLKLAEATALFHDVGRSEINTDRGHGEIGADMARDFLKENNFFTPEEINELHFAIANHNSPTPVKEKLAQIVRDADILDLLGVVGLIREINGCKIDFFDPRNIKGEAWGKTNQELNKEWDRGEDPRKYLVDRINFYVSCYELLNTNYAKKIGKPLADFQKNFIIQLEKEIKQSLPINSVNPR